MLLDVVNTSAKVNTICLGFVDTSAHFNVADLSDYAIFNIVFLPHACMVVHRTSLNLAI